MHAFALTKQAKTRSGSKVAYSYPAINLDQEADAESIFIDTGGEAHFAFENLLDHNLKKLKKGDIIFFKEEKILAWPHSPVRLGRFSANIFGTGLVEHNELDTLSAQLAKLRTKKPHKKHFRFAIINGFGANLGDNLVGVSAFRLVAKNIKNTFPSFAVDVLYGPATNPANADLVGYETWVDQVKFKSPSLAEFAQYDAYFDFSGLIGYPKYNEMPVLDWYLWWCGLNPSHYSDEEKSTQGYLRWQEYEEIREKISEISGLKVFFNPKASVRLRSIPEKKAIKLAKDILKADPNISLIIDQKIDFQHPRVIDLSKEINSVEKHKALIASVNAIISVDTFALHWASVCLTPSVGLFTSTDPSFIIPYYRFSHGVLKEDFKNLPAYKKPKVPDEEWKKIKILYEKAWKSISSQEIIDAMKLVVESKKTSTSALRKLNLINKREDKKCLLNKDHTFYPKYQISEYDFRIKQERLNTILVQLLKPGMYCILAGCNEPETAVQAAKKIQNFGQLTIFEPREVLMQCNMASLVSQGLMNVRYISKMPLGVDGKSIFIPKLDVWSESKMGYWGNSLNKIPIETTSLDELGVSFCHVLVIQVPMPIVKVLEEGCNFLRLHRPILIINKISQEEISLISYLNTQMEYDLWLDKFSHTESSNDFVLIAIPKEKQLFMQNFVKVEIK